MKLQFLTLALLTIISYSHAQIDSGLVAYYPFNANAIDESIYGNDAEVISGPQIVADRMGSDSSAFDFDGSNDFIMVPHSSIIAFSQADAFAFSLWLKAPEEQANIDGEVNDILAKWPAAGQVPYSYSLRLFNQTYPGALRNKLWFGRFEGVNLPCDKAPFVGGETEINDDQWHHVVFQRTSNRRLELYVDGALESMAIDNTTCQLSNDRNLYIGLRALSAPNPIQRRPFTGSIDDIRVYNRSLSWSDIQTLANDGVVATLPPDPHIAATIKVLPNPITASEFQLQNDSGLDIASLRLYDTQGRLIRIFEERYELEEVNPGVYFLQIELDNQQKVVKKIIRL